MKIKKMTTLANCGIDLIRACINFFILWIVLILFKGLKTRTILKDFKFMVLKEISIRLNLRELSFKKNIPSYNYCRIDKVPSISQIRIGSQNEPKCYYSQYCLDQEDHSECNINFVNYLVPICFWISVVIIVESEGYRIKNNN